MILKHDPGLADELTLASARRHVQTFARDLYRRLGATDVKIRFRAKNGHIMVVSASELDPYLRDAAARAAAQSGPIV